jgi:hypothetical protein
MTRRKKAAMAGPVRTAVIAEPAVVAPAAGPPRALRFAKPLHNGFAKPLHNQGVPSMKSLGAASVTGSLSQP